MTILLMFILSVCLDLDQRFSISELGPTRGPQQRATERL